MTDLLLTVNCRNVNTDSEKTADHTTVLSQSVIQEKENPHLSAKLTRHPDDTPVPWVAKTVE